MCFVFFLKYNPLSVILVSKIRNSLEIAKINVQIRNDANSIINPRFLKYI